MTLNTFLRRAILLGLFLVPFIPLIVSGTMFFPFITGKNFTFRIIVGIILALWIILVARDKSYRPNWSAILVSFAAFVGVITLADIFGENPYRSFWSNYERMEGLIAHLHLFAYFIVLSTILKTEQLWDRLIHTIFGVSVFLSFYGIIQKTGGLIINQGGARVDATFGNATYFAVFTLFMVFLAAYFLVRYSSDKFSQAIFVPLVGSLTTIVYSFVLYFLRMSDTLAAGGGSASVKFFLGDANHQAHLWLFLLSVAIIIVCLPVFLMKEDFSEKTKKIIALSLYTGVILLNGLMLYFTETRGAILGLVGGLILVAFLMTVGNWQIPKVRNFALGGLVGILTLVGLFIAFKDSAFIRSSSTFSRLADISLTEQTTKSRFTIWNMSWEGFKEKPILGWGQDNFIVVFGKYYKPSMWSQEPWFDRSHNVFFDWLIAGGALGLLSYLALFGSGVYVLWRKTKIPSAGKNILIGLLGAYFIQNLFVFDNLTSYIMFFTVLGYISFLGYGETAFQKTKSPNKPSAPNPNLLSENSTYIAATLALPVLISVLYFANVKPIQASGTLIQALSQHKGGVPENISLFKKVFDLNTFGSGEAREQLMQIAVRLRNSNVPDNLKVEVASLARDQMLIQIEKAKTDVRYELYLGSLLNSFGAYDEAIEHLNSALSLSPHKQPILFEIGSAYLNKGDFVSSLKHLKTAHEESPEYLEARIIYATGLIYSGRGGEAKKLLEETGNSAVFSDPRIVGAGAYVNRVQE